MEIEEKPDVTYDDVGGCADALRELREVVETPLLHPERFTDLGIDPPKGVLLYGPPGTGKTLSARAVANRTEATFIRVLGSELVQKYVGEGARIVRELFQLARSKKACIVRLPAGIQRRFSSTKWTVLEERGSTATATAATRTCRTPCWSWSTSSTGSTPAGISRSSWRPIARTRWIRR